MARLSAICITVAGAILATGAGFSQAVGAVQVGVSTPMQRIMIKGQQKGWPFEPYEGTYATSYSLSLARNEHEAFQVVIIPDQNLTNARVTVSTPQPTGGQGAFDGQVGVWLVAHVKGAAKPRIDLNIEYPPYLVNYNTTDNGGWWPDPLLTFKDSCNISANERVAFWINVTTTGNTPAGDYSATVTVSADGINQINLPLTVRVWDFTLPAQPSLPTAFSIDSLWEAGWVYGNDWPGTIRNKFYQMHQAHRLSVTEIYTSRPKDANWWAPWMSLNNAFCLSLVPTKDANGLTTMYQYFSGIGRLHETYVYGYDEITAEQFQDMATTFNAIHQAYPGLRTMTTAYDNSFGTSPYTTFLREAVDLWVPGTLAYSKSAAHALRAEGKDLWWYLAEYPRHPAGGNWLLEYPPIEARLLMGAKSFKYDPAGFLYYAVTKYGYSLWQSGIIPKQVPIENGPYTSWDGRVAYSDKYSGYTDADGCLYYPGPVSVGPLPSIRVENIRDGLEDYEYLHMLKGLTGRMTCLFPAGDPTKDQFIAEANALLAVPGNVVTHLGTSGFTRDPAILYAYRAQVAAKILEGRVLMAGTPDLSDTDRDGVYDPCDNCPTIYNSDQLNTDRDEYGNICDDDDDGDGVLDATDNCPLISNSNQADADGDGVGDVCDNCPNNANPDQADNDGDGFPNACDNCPRVANTNQADGDADGVGNVCDNCPTTPNTNQADDDDDGLGNPCDPDPTGAKRLDEEFDGALTGADKTGSWDQTSMNARWPLTYSYNGSGTFTAGQGINPAGAALKTNKTCYRMTANLEPDMSATYGAGNQGIGTCKEVNGTDAKPLVVEWTVDFRGETYGSYSNFYVELSNVSGNVDDPAPRTGLTTEDPNLSNGDQGPWRAGRVYRALAFGSFNAVNLPPGTAASGSKGAPCYFDGQRWWYAKSGNATDVNGTYINLWKHSKGGLSTFRMTVKTSTIVVQLTNPGDTPEMRGPNEFARSYRGGFNRVSLTMGNILGSSAMYSWVDEIEVRNGVLTEAPCTGACCIPLGDGVGTCQITSQSECQSLQGSYRGNSTVCGQQNEWCDFCPSDPNKIVAGQCGCGTPDTDSDGDGTANCNDPCPHDPDKTVPGICGCGISDIDTDADGTEDCNDPCPRDPDKIQPGVCGCGTPDIDTDNDGTEDCIDLCPQDPGKIDPSVCGCGIADTDTDQDGTADCIDLCPLDPGKIDPLICGCGVPETDTDADDTPDCVDSCPEDADKIAPGICGCGLTDADVDNNGSPDCADYCPDDPRKSLPGRCGCGVSDIDTDRDGVPDCHDQCPRDPRKIEPGICGCGVPDIDTDGDGTLDCHDGCKDDPAKIAPGVCGCGVPDIDTDRDGTLDCRDACKDDPAKIAPGVCGCGVPDIDTDCDGTLDCRDACRNDPAKILPGICGCGTPDVDSDGDTRLDCQDQCKNDPRKILPGACGCGQPEIDSDGDGAPDCIDGCPSNQSKVQPGPCGCFLPETDTDQDGAPDCQDECPRDPNKTDAGVCGCGIPDTDTDRDGTLDCRDACPRDSNKTSQGLCGCGLTDEDLDGDGEPDCTDVCPNDPLKSMPGVCGCGIMDIDTDGDGTLDCLDSCPADPLKTVPGVCGCNALDIDSDTDGVLDCKDNCPVFHNPNQADTDGDGVGDACPGTSGTGQPTPDTDTTGRTPPNCGWGFTWGLMGSLLGLYLMGRGRRQLVP